MDMQLVNEILKDNGLTLREKSLLMIFIQQPDITYKEIYEIVGDKMASLRSGVYSLIEKGYLTQETHRGQKQKAKRQVFFNGELIAKN